jgi:ribosomal protein S18 acetylase RimI-like enzyme
MQKNRVDILKGVRIRSLEVSEEEFLKEMLIEAIYLPPSEKEKLSRDIIYHPDLNIYFENWGRPGDLAVVAETDFKRQLVGCAWGRLFKSDRKGYGFINEDIPELSLSVKPSFRNRGIGTQLIRIIIDEYRRMGFDSLSLSVSKINPCVQLYKRENFRIYREKENDFLMLHNLRNDKN